jgi:hypothetical protein
MAHHDLRRENSASRSRESDEQYLINELQAHLLEEANGAHTLLQRRKSLALVYLASFIHLAQEGDHMKSRLPGLQSFQGG